MREGKNWSTQWASFPAPLPHPSSPYTASSLRNKIQRAAWCSNNMTQLSVLILHYTSLLRNSERIFTLFLPHHFWPLRAEFVFKFQEWCQGLPTTFPCEEGLCKAAWDTKAIAQKDRANTRTIIRLFHALHFPAFPTQLLSWTTYEVQTPSRFLIAM